MRCHAFDVARHGKRMARVTRPVTGELLAAWSEDELLEFGNVRALTLGALRSCFSYALGLGNIVYIEINDII